MTRCSKRCKPSPLPAGLPIESARNHPTFKYRLEPGAQCELDEGHPGEDPDRHRNGSLIWWDPPAIFVDGERVR